MARQSALDTLKAKQEADRIFLETQQQKAQKAREDGRTLQDHYIHQMVSLPPFRGKMHNPGVLGFKCTLLAQACETETTLVCVQAEKHVRHQQLKVEQRESEAKNAGLVAAEEAQFQRYASHVIRAAAEAQRNVFPLNKAAREGLGGGLGPVVSGLRPSYLVQDNSGVEMPRYVCGTTQNIKELNETVDIEGAKKRLGFTW